MAFSSTPLWAQTGSAWQPSLDAARRTAAYGNRLVLIFFEADWCPACKAMQRDTLAQPSVLQALQANYALVMINADQMPRTATDYGVNALPTTVITTPDGRLLEKIPGHVEASQYVARLNRLAANARAAAPPTYAQIPGPPASAPAAAPSVAATSPAPPAVPSYTPPVTPPYTPPAVPSYTPPAAPSYTPAGVASYAPPTGPAVAATGVPAGSVPAANPAANGPPPASPEPSGPSFGPANPSLPAANPPATSNVAAQPPVGWPASTNNVYTGPVAPPPASTPNTAAAAISPPLALDGYCPVRLIETRKWVAGDRRYGLVHRGRTYLFAGPEERDRFNAAPDRYAPVFSANDIVLAVDAGQTVPGRREHGVFYGNRIYLFSDESTLQKFGQDPNRYSDQALQAMRAGASLDQRLR